MQWLNWPIEMGTSYPVIVGLGGDGGGGPDNAPAYPVGSTGENGADSKLHTVTSTGGGGGGTISNPTYGSAGRPGGSGGGAGYNGSPRCRHRSARICRWRDELRRIAVKVVVAVPMR